MVWLGSNTEYAFSFDHNMAKDFWFTLFQNVYKNPFRNLPLAE